MEQSEQPKEQPKSGNLLETINLREFFYKPAQSLEVAIKQQLTVEEDRRKMGKDTQKLLENILQTSNPQLITTRLIEWEIASILAGYANNWSNLLEENKPKINPAKLREYEVDQARIIRFLIHNVSFPKGISPDNPTLNFSLEKKDLNSLIEIIKTFPAYNNFGMQELLNIIGNMGFTKNPYAENYLLRIDNEDYKQLIRNICYTHSYSTRDQKKFKLLFNYLMFLSYIRFFYLI